MARSAGRSVSRTIVWAPNPTAVRAAHSPMTPAPRMNDGGRGDARDPPEHDPAPAPAGHAGHALEEPGGRLDRDRARDLVHHPDDGERPVGVGDELEPDAGHAEVHEPAEQVRPEPAEVEGRDEHLPLAHHRELVRARREHLGDEVGVGEHLAGRLDDVAPGLGVVDVGELGGLAGPRPRSAPRARWRRGGRRRRARAPRAARRSGPRSGPRCGAAAGARRRPSASRGGGAWARP